MTTTRKSIDEKLRADRVELDGEVKTRILDAISADAASLKEKSAEPGFHLAQMNTARFRLPMDHPDMTGFVEMLDPLNNQADAAAGFVWRLTDEGSNNATSITYYDDPLLLVNMSVWTDVQSLRDYVYRTSHKDMVKRRKEWADMMESVHMVLWWVPAGHRPDIAEADAKLNALRQNGPTAEAFTFGHAFPPPG